MTDWKWYEKWSKNQSQIWYSCSKNRSSDDSHSTCLYLQRRATVDARVKLAVLPALWTLPFCLFAFMHSDITNKKMKWLLIRGNSDLEIRRKGMQFCIVELPIKMINVDLSLVWDWKFSLIFGFWIKRDMTELLLSIKNLHKLSFSQKVSSKNKFWSFYRITNILHILYHRLHILTSSANVTVTWQ